MTDQISKETLDSLKRDISDKALKKAQETEASFSRLSKALDEALIDIYMPEEKEEMIHSALVNAYNDFKFLVDYVKEMRGLLLKAAFNPSEMIDGLITGLNDQSKEGNHE